MKCKLCDDTGWVTINGHQFPCICKPLLKITWHCVKRCKVVADCDGSCKH